jgi:hypothetical protein
VRAVRSPGVHPPLRRRTGLGPWARSGVLLWAARSAAGPKGAPWPLACPCPWLAAAAQAAPEPLPRDPGPRQPPTTSGALSPLQAQPLRPGPPSHRFRRPGPPSGAGRSALAPWGCARDVPVTSQRTRNLPGTDPEPSRNVPVTYPELPVTYP